jgi:hypothetical protein
MPVGRWFARVLWKRKDEHRTVNVQLPTSSRGKTERQFNRRDAKNAEKRGKRKRISGNANRTLMGAN